MRLSANWATAAPLLVALVCLAACTAPSDAQESWQQLPMPAGVAADNVRDLMVAPSGDLYLSFDRQGVWRFATRTSVWQNVQDNLPALAAGGFLGLNRQGEVLFAVNDHARQGIYRLPEKGTAWVPAAYDPVPLGSSGCPGRLVLNKAGDVICVAGANGANRVMRSTDGGRTFAYTEAVLGGAAIFDVKANPSNPDEIAIGTETGPTWRSDDGGLSWTDIGKPGGNARLAYNRLGQLFASATHDAAAKGWLLARWTGGSDWVQSDSGLPAYQDTRSSAESASGWMFLGSATVCVSKDDGATWQQLGAGFAPGADARRVKVSSLAVDDSNGWLYAGVRTGSPALSSAGPWRLSLAEGGGRSRAPTPAAAPAR